MSDFILAIDQGTSQTKALIMDRGGRVLATNAAPVYTNIIGETRIEQDPLDILRSVELACAPLLEQYPAQVAGLDNQGETFLLWDAQTGAPLTPAISWQDKRGAAICQELEAAGHGPLIRERTGLLLDSYFSASKLAYLLRENAELARRADAGAAALRYGRYLADLAAQRRAAAPDRPQHGLAHAAVQHPYAGLGRRTAEAVRRAARHPAAGGAFRRAGR